ncbi:MAG: exopolysaccharide Pel transporter PelG [Candidatus Gastranaerophilales bacterium]|nr:exopolysaccharide Pel transporter PelG [Candidatus Gastranaerophilales bacterium]
MAGIGVRLNRIYSKNTIITSLFGFGYSMMITVAPMFFVILAVIVMQQTLGFSKVGYADRELYTSTILYIFIFALLTASPFNAVLSKYMSDVIYKDQYDDILPCYYVGLVINIGASWLLGVPFCIWEYVVGKVWLPYVLMGFCGYIALVLVFYTELYLSICKDYKKISLFFMIGMSIAILLSLVLVYLMDMAVTNAMLLSMDIGFMVIACLEFALIRSYFRENSLKYKEVLQYLKKYWQLMVTNFLYTFGMFVHNFVFWTTDMHTVVAKSFVSMTSYDMATCLAMFTNITTTVIFISRVEMHFHERYKLYSEAVIGGRGMDIESTKKRMFMQLSEELMNLARIQFIISASMYLLFTILLPRLGMGGMVMKIYPCLTAGYFILFIMYSALIFLYYFNDLIGAMMMSGAFCATTLVASIVATHLPSIWYGLGVVIGSLVGWGVAYHRLRLMEKGLDVHIFCNGNIMEKGIGERPSNKVFDRTQQKKEVEA